MVESYDDRRGCAWKRQNNAHKISWDIAISHLEKRHREEDSGRRQKLVFDYEPPKIKRENRSGTRRACVEAKGTPSRVDREELPKKFCVSHC
jgi:superfamily I DNA and/or RNA helicase